MKPFTTPAGAVTRSLKLHLTSRFPFIIWLLMPMLPAMARAGEPPPTAPPMGPPVPVELRITEVMADPLLLEDKAGEYIEIANVGATTVVVAGLQLVLPSGKTLSLTTAGKRKLPPGGVLVVCPLGNRAGAVALKGMRLPDRAGRVELRRKGLLLDVAQWTRKWPWPKGQAGRSLELKGPRLDGRVGRSWRRSRVPLFGVERGSPGVVAWLKKR